MDVKHTLSLGITGSLRKVPPIHIQHAIRSSKTGDYIGTVPGDKNSPCGQDQVNLARSTNVVAIPQMMSLFSTKLITTWLPAAIPLL